MGKLTDKKIKKTFGEVVSTGPILYIGQLIAKGLERVFNEEDDNENKRRPK